MEFRGYGYNLKKNESKKLNMLKLRMKERKTVYGFLEEDVSQVMHNLIFTKYSHRTLCSYEDYFTFE